MTPRDVDTILDEMSRRFGAMETAQQMQAKSIDMIAEGFREHLREADADHDDLTRLKATLPTIAAAAAAAAAAVEEIRSIGKFVRVSIVIVATLIGAAAALVGIANGLNWI